MEQTKYYHSRLENLLQAVDGLSKSMEMNAQDFNPTLGDLIRCGHVQKFEYCIELLWKTIKLWLVLQEIVDVNSPKSVIKAYYQAANLSDALYQRLLTALHHRNLYSHVYNEDDFGKLYQQLSQHVATINEAVKHLSSLHV